ncbi:MAG: alkaline phosphatase PhoX [Vicinamibacterales bacterium]
MSSSDVMQSHDRRTFLRRGAMGAGALWAVSLQEMMARQAVDPSIAAVSPYGPVGPRIDQTTGLPLLQLPEGFSYFSYGWNGDRMSDGIRTPPLHDGMAVVDLYNGNPDLLVLVRNHELDGLTTPYVNKPEITYSTNGGGGTTNLIFDARRGRLVKSWASLAGTIRNCAGGVTPWGSWITGEETALSNAAGSHGWCYDVGPQAGNPTALTAMGRFSHEAVMVDPATGDVYETEDSGTTSGFYRFVAHVPGQLAAGGDLSMLKVKHTTQLHLGSAAVVGTIWDVEWVRVVDPLATRQSTYAQGRALGATGFNRLEGAWWGTTTGYFLSTSGGSTQNGQVFEFNPGAGTLTLIYNSPDFTMTAVMACALMSAAAAEAVPITYDGTLTSAVTASGVSTRDPFQFDEPVGADYWRFSAPAGATVLVTGRRTAGHYDMALWVFAGLFTDTDQFAGPFDQFTPGYVARFDDEAAPFVNGPFGDPQGSFRAVAGGLYTVVVTNGLSDPGSPNAYTLALSAVPEPGTVALFGAGLVGVARRLRRRV